MPTLTRSDAAHLLRRAGFGASPAELDAYTGLERAVAVERVLDVGRNPPATDTPGGHAVPEQAGENEYYLWVDMSTTGSTGWPPCRCRSRRRWRCSGTATSSASSARSMTADVCGRRTNCSGEPGSASFRALAQAVAVDPAMLLYLDNYQNVAGQPQGELRPGADGAVHPRDGQFSQDDVVGVARAWTGHGL